MPILDSKFAGSGLQKIVSYRTYLKTHLFIEIVFMVFGADFYYLLEEALAAVFLIFAALETGLKIYGFLVV